MLYFALLKTISSIALIVLLLLNSMVYSVIVGNYVINKQEIVDKFCINNGMPELQCDGKCYLAQQLQAEKEKKNGESQHFFALDFGLYIPCPTVVLSGLFDEIVNSNRYFPTTELFADAYCHSVEIPPKI
jgi:hypothetical protein